MKKIRSYKGKVEGSVFGTQLKAQDAVTDAVRVILHQVSASMLRQLCDDACDTALIENNGVAPEWTCNPFSIDSIVFNENRIASSCRSIQADAWCKWALVERNHCGLLD